MPERQPSFALYRPVINVGLEEVTRFQDNIARMENFNQERFAGLFRPADSLVGTVIGEAEVVFLHQKAKKPITPEGIETLAAYVQAELERRVKLAGFITDTLPARFLPWKRRDVVGGFLSIAGSPDLRNDRKIAKTLLEGILEPDPQASIWYEDEATARVLIAKAENDPIGLGMLRRANELTQKNPRGLPTATELGKLTVRTFGIN